MTKSSQSGQDLVLQYLKKQRRPYNSQDISLNLKGALSKTQVVKVLQEAYEQGLLP
jgi:hypothetical protein